MASGQTGNRGRGGRHNRSRRGGSRARNSGIWRKDVGQIDTWNNSKDHEGLPDSEAGAAQVTPASILPEGCAQLVNWDGGWAPAPVDWEPTRAFDKPLDYMNKWVHDSVVALSSYLNAMPFSLDYEDAAGIPTKAIFSDAIDLGGMTVEDFRKQSPGTDIVIIGEIAPRYWMPEELEHNLNANTFWELFKALPPTFDCDYADSDLPSRVPWWQRYPGQYAFFMPPPDSGITLPVDLERETKDFTKRRLADKGSTHASKQYVDKMKAAEARRKKKALAEVANAYPALDPDNPDKVAETYALPDTSIKPKIDLFVRQVCDYDVTQLCEIYNHYVEKSCVVADANPITKNAMLDRMRRIQSANLPFLVAVRQRTKKIVGFIYCDDFNDDRGMYRFTAELEVFTRPGFERKGVAKVLMNQTLAIVDPDHLKNCGENVEVEETVGLGVQRRIKNVLINLALSRRKKQQWLLDGLVKLGWKQAGFVEEIGYKDCAVIDMAIFQKITGERINKDCLPL
ncbi:hypothetical protein K461DRAFT_270133 [Myriangium duriaei CBS 260.36]|uniref:N-acetyltransferase domain-containing protein n=1 Tax=Myriangium duriaei CBS 260.36 TaxID=1168546 RepID=A0A9P4IVI7_9PEZI|nr:hypothetical protein K461DRAFT_270133 [Myriangium duriaei CBS 260.36]